MPSTALIPSSGADIISAALAQLNSLRISSTSTSSNKLQRSNREKESPDSRRKRQERHREQIKSIINRQLEEIKIRDKLLGKNAQQHEEQKRALVEKCERDKKKEIQKREVENLREMERVVKLTKEQCEMRAAEERAKLEERLKAEYRTELFGECRRGLDDVDAGRPIVDGDIDPEEVFKKVVAGAGVVGVGGMGGELEMGMDGYGRGGDGVGVDHDMDVEMNDYVVGDVVAEVRGLSSLSRSVSQRTPIPSAIDRQSSRRTEQSRYSPSRLRTPLVSEQRRTTLVDKTGVYTGDKQRNTNAHAHNFSVSASKPKRHSSNKPPSPQLHPHWDLNLNIPQEREKSMVRMTSFTTDCRDMIREAGRISDGHFLRLFDSEERDLLRAGNIDRNTDRGDRGGGIRGRIDDRIDRSSSVRNGELVSSSNGDVSDNSSQSSGSETEEQEGNRDDRDNLGIDTGRKVRPTARYSLEDVYDCWDEMLR